MQHLAAKASTPQPKTTPEAPPIEIDPGKIHVKPEVDIGEKPSLPQEPVPERPFEPQPLPEREEPGVPEIEPYP
jgi:hypothetical protein